MGRNYSKSIFGCLVKFGCSVLYLFGRLVKYSAVQFSIYSAVRIWPTVQVPKKLRQWKKSFKNIQDDLWALGDVIKLDQDFQVVLEIWINRGMAKKLLNRYHSLYALTCITSFWYLKIPCKAFIACYKKIGKLRQLIMKSLDNRWPNVFGGLCDLIGPQ